MIVLGILAALAGVVVIAVISWSAASRPGAEARRNPVTAPAIDAASAQEMLSRLPTVSGWWKKNGSARRSLFMNTTRRCARVRSSMSNEYPSLP